VDAIDLLDRIRLGQQCLVGCLDGERRHAPQWYCLYNPNRNAMKFWSHGSWDYCHDVARAIHGLAMAEEVTHERVDDAIMADLADLFFDLFDSSDDMPGTADDVTGNRYVSLHNIREATHALTALIRRGDARAERCAQRMIHVVRQMIDPTGRMDTDRFPESVKAAGAYTHQPHQEGRAVDALVRHYRVTGNAEAVDLASIMTTFALDHCFTPDGQLTAAAGEHGHSINAMVAGMLDLAVLTHDASLLSRVRKVYDVGLPQFNSSFGWSMEMLPHCTRGEANNTGDMLRCALLLGRWCEPKYFEQAERILRSHLLPSQLIDIEPLLAIPSDDPEQQRHLAQCIRGGFSFPLPNDLLYQADDVPIVTYDITSGAVDALIEAWHAIVTDDASGIRINLLLTCERHGVRIVSHLPKEGRFEIHNPTHRSVWVRVPSWVPSHELQLTVNGVRETVMRVGSFILISASAEVQDISVHFPLPKSRTTETMNGQSYTIDWCGDQITAMSPAARYWPMFPPCKD